MVGLIYPVNNEDAEDAVIMKKVYTIGTSNLTMDEFYSKLVDNKIQTLVDIRSHPTSRYSRFKQENLTSFCLGHDIEYLWMGDLLGGFQDMPFKEYIKTEPFAEGIKKLKEYTDTRNIVMCCSEKDYKKCHRRYISNELSNDYNMIHV